MKITRHILLLVTLTLGISLRGEFFDSGDQNHNSIPDQMEHYQDSNSARRRGSDEDKPKKAKDKKIKTTPIKKKSAPPVKRKKTTSPSQRKKSKPVEGFISSVCRKLGLLRDKHLKKRQE